MQWKETHFHFAKHGAMLLHGLYRAWLVKESLVEPIVPGKVPTALKSAVKRVEWSVDLWMTTCGI